MRTVAFCEINPYCRGILRKHWRNKVCFNDVRELNAETLYGTIGNNPIQVIAGGFPCQDISVAGKGAGIDGERSGLWGEYARLIGELRPSYAIVENTSALLGRGLGRVLGDLAALGYDAEWHCIPASAVGAPHQRDRVWIIAYPESGGRGQGDKNRGGASQRTLTPQKWRRFANGIRWKAEPAVSRVDDGVSDRVDRTRCLGNAVVPQIPEIIGRAILEAEGMK